ncbi:Uncharacterized protein Rs2_22887 [Raphanus sativus]|uniref:Uncharacterized protein LOC108857229 n=1 Tax=Raphanus sativus TaxID=3726 RepID=A0A6J0NSK0_RAPSA|nr:uncharacterized protein LOC108857229 [Raphanus sativus]KAJ4896093.1 Uncharacterized protein Rs2_22887 [Raphanus sativus]
MDSVFRSAREKLEKEHRESRETGKLKLEREKKDKEAAERQRQAVEASQRARRLEAIESQMMKVEDNLREEKEDVIARRGGDCIIQAIPPWMKTNMPQRIAKEKYEDVFEWDDAEGAEWEVGDAPGTGSCQRFTWNVRAQEEEKNKTTAAGKNTEGK